MLDTRCTDYWILIEVLVKKLPILRGECRPNARRVTRGHFQSYRRAYGALHRISHSPFNLLCVTCKKHSVTYDSFVRECLIQRTFIVETSEEEISWKVSRIFRIRFLPCFTSFEIKYVWELEEIISNTWTDMRVVICGNVRPLRVLCVWVRFSVELPLRV